MSRLSIEMLPFRTPRKRKDDKVSNNPPYTSAIDNTNWLIFRIRKERPRSIEGEIKGMTNSRVGGLEFSFRWGQVLGLCFA